VTVTVAMPWHGAPELLERAVRSVLAQTHRDLVLVVVGDGARPPIAFSHDRLVTYTLPENRGPYFAQEVVLEATRHEWYAPHAADDWSEPEHLERLLAHGHSAAVPGVVRWEEGGGSFVHEGRYEVGVFRPSRLREIGGFNVGERIGQDTLMLKLLDLTGGMVVDMALPPTYHRVRRPGALTTSPETGFGSPARNEMRARNRAIYARAQSLVDDLPALARFRRRAMSPALRVQVAEHAGELRRLIA